MADFIQMSNDFTNGNLSEFSRQVKKLSKKTLINFIGYLIEGGMSAKDALNEVYKALRR